MSVWDKTIMAIDRVFDFYEEVCYTDGLPSGKMIGFCMLAAFIMGIACGVGPVKDVIQNSMSRCYIPPSIVYQINKNPCFVVGGNRPPGFNPTYVASGNVWVDGEGIAYVNSWPR